MTEQEQMIDDCEKRESRLDEWSVGFLDSIAKQIADGQPLTEKQDDRLTAIWETATAKG